LTWYEDLGPIDYFREASCPEWRAVGWLGWSHPFPEREVSPQFFEHLCSLLVDPWDPHQFRGYHECEVCPGEWEIPPGPDPGEAVDPIERAMRIHGMRKAQPSEPVPIVVGDRVLDMGRQNLFVPGVDCVYVAPSLIAHYIQAHRYSPPNEFVDAVLRCPEMHSQEYLHARRTLPREEFIRWTIKCREPRSPEYLEALRASGATKLVEWSPWWMSTRPPPERQR
jgi:hypothetical protein